MENKLREALNQAVGKVTDQKPDIQLSRPDPSFGDFASNIALVLAKTLSKEPLPIAKSIAAELKKSKDIKDVSVAGPGFINITLPDETIAKVALNATKLPKPLAGSVTVVEYSDPNPFKVLHVGHLYTSVVGDSISNLLDAQGANTHRVNFGGDVGLHVAKTIWAVLRDLGSADKTKLQQIPEEKRSEWLAEKYIEGNKVYDEADKNFQNIDIKLSILNLNAIIYDIWNTPNGTLLALEEWKSLGFTNPPLSEDIKEVYLTTRDWSYNYYKEFYKRIGSGFEKYYPESETVEPGLEMVKANIGKVFEQSDGAIIFKGEVHNLHTRVFINSEGLPTYETKDLGLAKLKDKDYHFDRSVIITGNEQAEYMEVVLKALEQIRPDLTSKTTHITHGMVRLAGGAKMSSRKGNIIKAEDVLTMTGAAQKKINGKEDSSVALGALRYAFLKNRIGADFVFDPIESVAVEGNSGPYLQYAHARAASILSKTKVAQLGNDFDEHERALALKVSEYQAVIDRAVAELMPHHICNYLYELCQEFNRFYEHCRVTGDAREAHRAGLVKAYKQVLKNGLSVLNIEAPERI